MPKTEKVGPTKAKMPPRAVAKDTDSEERLDAHQRRLARLNREAELLGAAMSQKPKKS
jgi:hypothetical protein